jgi:hypothetical protein
MFNLSSDNLTEKFSFALQQFRNDTGKKLFYGLKSTHTRRTGKIKDGSGLYLRFSKRNKASSSTSFLHPLLSPGGKWKDEEEHRLNYSRF